MAEQNLVLHESYGSIRLTPTGRFIGWQIYMKHERLTSFFQDFLGQDAKLSEETACLIEHHLDDTAAGRLFNLIDFLQQARFENKEWMKDLFLSLGDDVRMPLPLTLAEPDRCQGRVCRLSAEDFPDFQQVRQEIVLGAILEDVFYQETTGMYCVKFNKKQYSLSPAVAATIWII